MYNTMYEDYMRSVLGYTPNRMQDTYVMEDYYSNNNFNPNNNLELMYPDLYKKIYPLVCKECKNLTSPLTEDVLENMTNNVYNSIEIDFKFETSTKVEVKREESKNNNMRETESRQRRPQNDILRDLIRILILRELLGRDHIRPPFPRRRPMMPMGY